MSDPCIDLEFRVTMETFVIVSLKEGETVTWKTVCDEINESLGLKEPDMNARHMVRKIRIETVDVHSGGNVRLSANLNLKKLRYWEMEDEEEETT